MQSKQDYSDTKLKEIKLWAWAATVLPITGLAGVFFAWILGFDNWFHTIITIGATAMFAVAVFWWWWVMWTVAKIIKKEQKVVKELKDTNNHIKELKTVITKNVKNN